MAMPRKPRDAPLVHCPFETKGRCGIEGGPRPPPGPACPGDSNLACAPYNAQHGNRRNLIPGASRAGLPRHDREMKGCASMVGTPSPPNHSRMFRPRRPIRSVPSLLPQECPAGRSLQAFHRTCPRMPCCQTSLSAFRPRCRRDVESACQDNAVTGASSLSRWHVRSSEPASES